MSASKLMSPRTAEFTAGIIVGCLPAVPAFFRHLSGFSVSTVTSYISERSGLFRRGSQQTTASSRMVGLKSEQTPSWEMEGIVCNDDDRIPAMNRISIDSHENALKIENGCRVDYLSKLNRLIPRSNFPQHFFGSYISELKLLVFVKIETIRMKRCVGFLLTESTSLGP